MDKSREAFERNECEKYGSNYDDMKKNWDWYETQYGWRYPSDSPRGLEWATWDKAWQEQQKRIDELQARVDAANAVIHEYYTGSYQESPDLVVDLEQALKGGEA
ncbi:hypothetical protein NNO95_03910 [Acinetobacter baumannii]|uniref:hypothetical protein n=1 Tax=Acinetobacter baumannii TaxID=470 RepID=UPI0020CEC085|nr:hypothetical protein [Acinetobacter baumannii]MCQ1053523.1 hypothetical protein [Acinetobacter baumannii]